MLREATRAAHVCLEDGIGDLSERAAYVRYVRGLAAFRASLEPALAPWAAKLRDYWMTILAPLLAQDLADLGVAPLGLRPALPISLQADALGVLYVLEGSALGARVLVRKVEAFGFGPAWGARHLAHQAHSLDAWRRLVQILDTASYSAERAAASANAAFGMAQACMKQARHD